MRPGETYRLNSHVAAIQPDEGQTIVDLPAGTTVTVADEPGDNARFVNVIWKEKTVSIFTVDLEKRGTLVEGADRERGQSKAGAG